MSTMPESRTVESVGLRRRRSAGRLRAGWLALAGLALLGIGGCTGSSSPSEPSSERPAWLQSLIGQIESEPVTNPPSSILRYSYRGGTVYFRPSRCCDLPSDLFDRNGSLLCHADGGFSGGGDGRCPDFFSTRSDEELVWQDPRR